MAKYFLAVYTNQCKRYCDALFFSNFKNNLSTDFELHIVDNSAGFEYFDRLSRYVPIWSGINASIAHLYTPADLSGLPISPDTFRDRTMTTAMHNIVSSANYLREKFIKSGCQYFVIIESDILFPADFLDRLVEHIDQGEAFGGIYYENWHKKEWFDPSFKEIVSAGHVLCGCTLYKREMIEQVSFRYVKGNTKDFPDYWLSVDAVQKGFRLFHACAVKCIHLFDNEGSRGWNKLLRKD